MNVFKATFFIVLFAFLLSMAVAHKPRFPEGDGPFEVVEPSMSQAFYLFLEEGEEHTFVVPPLGRLEPIELLVLDNDLGRELDFQMQWLCDDGEEEKRLRTLDEPFKEPFSGLSHRYRVVDAVGPTDASCKAVISERNGKAGPYTFAIGEEERFGFSDIAIFFSLAGNVETWINGGK